MCMPIFCFLGINIDSLGLDEDGNAVSMALIRSLTPQQPRKPES